MAHFLQFLGLFAILLFLPLGFLILFPEIIKSTLHEKKPWEEGNSTWVIKKFPELKPKNGIIKDILDIGRS